MLFTFIVCVGYSYGSGTISHLSGEQHLLVVVALSLLKFIACYKFHPNAINFVTARVSQ